MKILIFFYIDKKYDRVSHANENNLLYGKQLKYINREKNLTSFIEQVDTRNLQENISNFTHVAVSGHNKNIVPMLSYLSATSFSYNTIMDNISVQEIENNFLSREILGIKNNQLYAGISKGEINLF